MSDIGSITKLSSIDAFNAAADKLLLGKGLTNEESSLLLSAAVLLLRYGLADADRQRSREFAYWIVLNYSLSSGDYRPLYDLSFELGLYPLSKAIAVIDKNSLNTFNNYIALTEVEDRFTDKVTITSSKNKLIIRFLHTQVTDLPTSHPLRLVKPSALLIAF